MMKAISITDPIFKAIAEYQAALDIMEGLEGDDAIGATFWKADAAEGRAWRVLMDTPPVTDDGRAALRAWAATMHPSFHEELAELLAA